MTYATLLTGLLMTALLTACGSTPARDTNTNAANTTPAADGLLEAVPDLEVQEVELDEANETRRVIAASVAGSPQPVGLFFLRDDAGQWQLRGRRVLASEHPYESHLRRFLEDEAEDVVALLHAMVRVDRNLGRIEASEVIATRIDGDRAHIDISFADAPALDDDPMTVTGDAQRIDGVWQRMGVTYPVSRSMHREALE